MALIKFTHFPEDEAEGLTGRPFTSLELDKGFLFGRTPFHEDSCPGGDGKVRLTRKVGRCDFSFSPSKISKLDGC